jgi:crotonobetainyl-CoA:carnitine CoA-transferase CaiB-like acyl-CoA transferase
VLGKAESVGNIEMRAGDDFDIVVGTYRTNPGEYNDWCVIVCHSDEEWQRLVQVMGAPSWDSSPKFAGVMGRLQHQEELDEHIEAWSMSLGKYELTERCQAAGVRALPVQSAEDRVERDPQLHQREMYLPMEPPAQPAPLAGAGITAPASASGNANSNALPTRPASS